ncbi:MAG: hypothetical protein A2Z88_04520 [Omnitrophica WOR_2 bacterium GWA2_47_8]|nr:MAG: hypothetical protein A2Z88_04520 [Omnitrophica WOR_2 bacterium GWA2_47_8]
MPSLRKIFMAVLFISLCAVRFSHAEGESLFMMENPLIGEKAPEFKSKNLQGKEVNLIQLREGKSTIAFFWATWCPHCREQLGKLAKAQEDFAQKGIKVILVDVGEEASQVKPFVAKNKIGFDVVLDENSEVAESYNIIGVPTFFFIDKDGTVRAVEHFLPEDYSKYFGNG